MTSEVQSSPLESQVLVDVIVLTYNQVNLVERALSSILEQKTSFEFHVAVHDDASEDGTRELLEEWRAQWPERISLILRDENGLSKGVNPSVAAILSTHSTYFAWCEGDDWWTDCYKLQKQVDFMEANPWCAVSHHGVEIVVEPGGDQEFAEYVKHMVSQEWRNQPRVSGLEFAKENFVLTGSAMVRRAALPERKLLAIHDVQPGDWITMALAAQSGDVGYLDDVMSAYRIHASNIWAKVGSELHADGDRALWFLGAQAEGEMRRAARRQAVELWLSHSPDADEIECPQASADLGFTEANEVPIRASLGNALEEVEALRRRILTMEQTRGWRLLERVRPIWRLVRPRR